MWALGHQLFEYPWGGVRAAIIHGHYIGLDALL
jgi:hypothetical protein